MKRLICATLALTLLGATAASAGPYNRGGGYHHRHHGGGGRDNGALIGLGIGLFALGAIAASSQRDRGYDRYDDRYDYGPPPPPPGYGQRYGYDRYGYRY